MTASVTTVYPVDSLAADPPSLYPDYKSTRLRAPRQPLVVLPHTLTEIAGPVFGHESVLDGDSDLTRRHGGEPLGERIIVTGRVTDEDGRPIPDTLIEVWQANAAGRYIHVRDQHPAPIDPNFSGAGRCVTGADGSYRFTSIKPGAYPWKNHDNAWRPAHIHFSLFGPSFLTRLVTQMYFPGDPLFPFDPIFNSVTDAAARARMVAAFDMATTEPEWALGYCFDIVLRGRAATPTEELPIMADRGITPSQTVGPFFAYALTPTAYDHAALVGNDLRTDDAVGMPIVIEGGITDGEGAPVPDAMIEIWQADGAGRYAATREAVANTRFKGFGRCESLEGRYRFLTVKPGAVAAPDGSAQAPHINVGVFARGVLKRLFTRIYFDDEAATATDPILALVPDDRRKTLIARRDGERDGLPRYVFDIRLQGDGETVFLAA